MYLDEDMLKNFGGVDVNSLNYITGAENDNQHEISEPFPENSLQSNYFNQEHLVSMFKKQKRTFSILSVNIQSLNAKINQLRIILADLDQQGYQFSAICLQESWLSHDSDTALLQLDGYTLISQGKICSAHGGLVIYLKKEYTYKILSLYKDSDIWEGQFLEISGNTLKGKIIIGNIYRPPRDINQNYIRFLTELEPVLQTLNNRRGELILTGDFNIDLLKVNDKQMYSDFFDLVTSHHFIPRITFPTRFSEHTATLIDNFYCKLTAKCANSQTGIFVTQLSDHLPYFIFLNTETTKITPPKYIEINTNDTNSIALLRQSLAAADIFSSLNTNQLCDPNENYNRLNNLIMKLQSKHLPVKSMKFNKHKHKHSKWITHGIIRSIRFRDKQYATLKKTNVADAEYQTLKSNLASYNKILKRSIYNAKKSYYCQQFHKYKHDIKNTWASIKQVLNRDQKQNTFPDVFYLKGKEIKNKQDIADTFNNYFTNIGSNLASEIHAPENASFKDYLKNPAKCTFHFEPVTEASVMKIIKQLKSKSSFGYDGLSTRLLKEILPEVIKSIALIINQCMNTGVFPDNMKVAKVIPLHKKDDNNIIINYRPISLLPAMSKVLEKVICNQINDYFTLNGLFCKNQYGFRPKHSTELAALHLVDDIALQMDNGSIPINVYLDFSKAFDTLDHEILLDKLKYYGIRGTEIKLFKDYLSNR